MNTVQSGISLRQLVNYIRKLHIKGGSLLLFQDGIISPEALQGLATELPKNGVKDTILLIVQNVHDIANLDEKEMNKYGWYKINQLLERMKFAQTHEEIEKKVDEEINTE